MIVFRVLILILLVAAAIGVNYWLDAPYQAQVREFTKKCHNEKGVVLQEYNSHTLLCFPAYE